MSKVDFYVLSGSGESTRQQFACRLAEKAYRLQHSVHIRVTNPESMQRVDDLLWTFRDGSFVPHEMIESTSLDPESPVTIGCDAMPSGECDLLINLGDTIPENVSSFPRVAEVVTSDDESKTRCRQHFADYRSQGHTLDTHKL